LDPSFSPRGGRGYHHDGGSDAVTMPTVCLRFRFEEHPKIRARMEACADI